MTELPSALDESWFEQAPHDLARALLGQVLVSELDGATVAGSIVEVEVYGGAPDPACHADRGYPTPRTQSIFGPAGHAYVYRIYGMYDCLNVVGPPGPHGKVSALLIRAVEPLLGLDIMHQRRATDRLRNLTSGPGKLCQAFAVTRSNDGHPLSAPPLWIGEGDAVQSHRIAASARIGLNEKTCGASTHFPWRYTVRDNPHVSRPP